jgi:hypothetical protein
VEEQEKQFTPYELSIWRTAVLTQHDHICEYCGDIANIAHHIIPKKLAPFFALDPDNGIACCEECHYKYGHTAECLPVTLFNSNLTWEAVVLSGMPFEVPNTPVTVVDKDGNELASENLPSAVAGEIVIGDNLAASCTNIAAALNAPGTTSATFTTLAAADVATIEDLN